MAGRQPAYLQGVGRGRGRGKTKGSNNVARKPGSDRSSSSSSSSHSSPVKTPSGDERFLDAVALHKASAQRHLDENNEYVSSEEEDINDEEILRLMVNSFNCGAVNGDIQDLGRTQEYLLTSVQAKANVCLVCIETIKKNEAIWSCCGCYSMFHINCIQKWVREGSFQRANFEDAENKPLPWCCPKCRHEYEPFDCPTRYMCFCSKEQDPSFDPWLVPHSCGQVCGKDLVPSCGHNCVLLCHPGPCPPCPQTVKVTCFCGRQPAETRRCGNRQWSCGKTCRRTLACGHHACASPCHAGECPPCEQTSEQSCQCGRTSCVRPCAHPVFQCSLVCGRTLSCGHHVCEVVCHGGSCSSCPRSGPRTCPCGKTKFELPCTEDVPTCVDTCGKMLDCGLHFCTQKCHTGVCGVCREMTVKQCRCGKKKREVQCCKEYLCESKCVNMRDCLRHQCKRKCCVGNCPPCELTCGKSLSCRNHKCASRCHPGRCYPCTLTVTLSCRCGATSITVPCGREKVTKPPRCSKKCAIAPNCAHPERDPHRCHFGRCPPCQQICGMKLPKCEHKCPEKCHIGVYSKVQIELVRKNPWDPKYDTRYEYVDKPCPPCAVPVPVPCLGKHEIAAMKCSVAAVGSCHRPCGRTLACGNHSCQLECHEVINAPDDQAVSTALYGCLIRSRLKAGETCSVCEEACLFDRPDGCSHSCLLPCHPGACPPCQQMIKMRCHCELVVRYIECEEWTHSDDRERDRLKSCKSRCPRKLPCGHNCKALCHPGSCPNPKRCAERVLVRCPCKRLKTDFLCNEVQAKMAKVECDEECLQHQTLVNAQKAIEEDEKMAEERKKQQQELEEFERKQRGKKRKPRKQKAQEGRASFVQTYGRFIIGPLLAVIMAMFLFYLFKT
ncbi:hypothetical protein CAPTEDRAFT_178429 [Capitella teleta]|uniref:RING-type domain-containing protein n=1 Tax=Capitella teleta TaxID=283909 RepID=R7TCV2_CAPTE|nr:hypothetical protein CAPTEDRAFT_178429 [Capitella teleta]|eukprot:ELT89307.1 hypothetical protein CAPTEDRAFT_178429 [Capitella teleta]